MSSGIAKLLQIADQDDWVTFTNIDLKRWQITHQQLPLTRSGGRSVIECQGCERACHMPVRWRQDIASIICDKPENMGLIRVAADELIVWRLDMKALSEILCQQLELPAPKEIIRDRLYNLGVSNGHTLFFMRGLEWPDSRETLRDGDVLSANPLIITLQPPVLQFSIPVISLSTLLIWHGNNWKIDRERLLPTFGQKVRSPTPSKRKRGAKPQHNWQAYRKKFDDLIADYGLPGIDQPELKNQAAIESKLIEWGEKEFGDAPAPSTVRRYVSQWLAPLMVLAHN